MDIEEDKLDPRSVCKALLAALDAHEGRRKKRKRNTTPDAIGIGIKRELLERAVRDAPPAEELEAWLVRQVDELGPAYGPGALRAMALDILNEWRFAATAPSFREWLERGAPSADSGE